MSRAAGRTGTVERGEGEATFVVYFLKSANAATAMEIRGAKPGSGYAATWFDPRSGATRKAAAVTATAAGRLPLPSRPDGEDWLVILRAAR